MTGDAYGAMPPRTPPTPARASLPMFLTGVVLIVATSVMGWQFFHRDAGYAAWWWGGYLLALGLWRGAWTRYSAARAETRLPLGGGGFAVVLVGLAVALGSVVALSSTSFVWRAPPQEFGVGSCWSDQDQQITAVPCGDRGTRYVAVLETTTQANCPPATRTAVPGARTGTVLCLVER